MATKRLENGSKIVTFEMWLENKGLNSYFIFIFDKMNNLNKENFQRSFLLGLFLVLFFLNKGLYIHLEKTNCVIFFLRPDYFDIRFFKF